MRTHQKSLNKKKLLDQGVLTLMEQGYHGTGIKEILNSVKVPKGSFYNYFQSKEDFGAQVIQHYIAPFIAQLNEHLDTPNQDALVSLRCYFDELINDLGKQHFLGGCLLGNLMGEIGDTSEICRKALDSAVRQYRDTLAVGLNRAQSEGAIRRDLSAISMADFLLNAWQGALLRMKIEKSIYPLIQCREQLLEGWFKA